MEGNIKTSKHSGIFVKTEHIKDRIAELENQMCRNEDLHTATEKLNDTIILKRFAERLKDKYVNNSNYCAKIYESFGGITPKDIDETLKECI